ncbi:sn-glycerol-3-phosphate ABC transporter permease UgpA [Conservatibacter flavescens]|uniref:sn-glycerol-3-phosphate transport system permease protein UgpA n=1 Tax=Conservatibacter flavescens TaxID=28161 RepID=A0A2M8S4F6_9PAST|nr:sn-glycerol-3-phosphate ABC transporter permease UgpA [Conservatibacter flavescens]PJG86029.1 sn-glycerol-3-phosphate ABC transporter permease UgpA [Conservatibacter flavescens]
MKIHYTQYRLLPWLLLLPQLFIIAVFFYWPAIQSLYQSFQMQDIFGSVSYWVGFDNFKQLFDDPTYWDSVYTTVYFSFWVTLLGLGLSLFLAFFMQRVIKGVVFYRTFLILPYAVSPIVVGVLWMFMFSPSFGIITYALELIGIDWNHKMNSDQAMWLVIFAAIWKQISYNFLFFYAGLQAIPKSLIEAAAIDGAGPWRRFFTIQFPLLWPTTFFLCVINIVYVFFDTFAIIDSLTQGGPGKATSTLVYRIYFDGFKAMDYGSSAAQSVVLMCFVLLLTVIQFRYMDKKGGY